MPEDPDIVIEVTMENSSTYLSAPRRFSAATQSSFACSSGLKYTAIDFRVWKSGAGVKFMG